jgi:hypothetical protein
MFFIPGCREVCLWLGAIDASRKTAERQLENGLSLFIYPVSLRGDGSPALWSCWGACSLWEPCCLKNSVILFQGLRL